MRFLLDENIPLSILNLLKNLGHSVKHIKNIFLYSKSDKEISEYAKNKKAILITRDLEFGSTILYPKNSHYGVIVLRLPYYFNAEQISKSLKEFISSVDNKDMTGNLVILELNRYRIKKL
ncbi:DUF5615 family PIN-like protein [Candidatus Pacearchaeota archaeon]|nr:DUF5615 family PIN-like protein [Candidatus Pacearchaeota archaeon]